MISLDISQLTNWGFENMKQLELELDANSFIIEEQIRKFNKFLN